MGWQSSLSAPSPQMQTRSLAVVWIVKGTVLGMTLRWLLAAMLTCLTAVAMVLLLLPLNPSAVMTH